MEMRCFRRLLGITYKDHITNEEVKRRIKNHIGPYTDLLTSVKQRKLKWYGKSQDQQALPKHSCRVLYKEEDVEVGRERGGRITSQNGQAWS